MAIYRLLQDSTYTPEQIERMTAAYEDACRVLFLTDKRNDPVTELVAKKIIEVAQTGLRDPVEIRKAALEALGVAPREP